MIIAVEQTLATSKCHKTKKMLKHILKTYTLELHFADLNEKDKKQDAIVASQKEELYQWLDGYLSNLKLGNKKISIDRIELDLGILGTANSRQEFVERFKHEFARTFQNVLKSQNPSSTGEAHNSSGRQIEFIEYFLEFGNFPWWVTSKKGAVYKSLMEMVVSTPDEVSMLCKKYLVHHQYRKRLFSHITMQQLVRLMGAYLPTSKHVSRLNTIRPIVDRLVAVPNVSKVNVSRGVQTAIIEQVVNPTQMDSKAFVELLLRHVAQETKMPYSDLLQKTIKLFQQRSSSNTSAKEQELLTCLTDIETTISSKPNANDRVQEMRTESIAGEVVQTCLDLLKKLLLDLWNHIEGNTSNTGKSTSVAVQRKPSGKQVDEQQRVSETQLSQMQKLLANTESTFLDVAGSLTEEAINKLAISESNEMSDANNPETNQSFFLNTHYSETTELISDYKNTLAIVKEVVQPKVKLSSVRSLTALIKQVSSVIKTLKVQEESHTTQTMLRGLKWIEQKLQETENCKANRKGRLLVINELFELVEIINAGISKGKESLTYLPFVVKILQELVQKNEQINKQKKNQFKKSTLQKAYKGNLAQTAIKQPFSEIGIGALLKSLDGIELTAFYNAMGLETEVISSSSPDPKSDIHKFAYSRKYIEHFISDFKAFFKELKGLKVSSNALREINQLNSLLNEIEESSVDTDNIPIEYPKVKDATGYELSQLKYKAEKKAIQTTRKLLAYRADKLHSILEKIPKAIESFESADNQEEQTQSTKEHKDFSKEKNAIQKRTVEFTRRLKYFKKLLATATDGVGEWTRLEGTMDMEEGKFSKSIERTIQGIERFCTSIQNIGELSEIHQRSTTIKQQLVLLQESYGIQNRAKQVQAATAELDELKSHVNETINRTSSPKPSEVLEFANTLQTILNEIKGIEDIESALSESQKELTKEMQILALKVRDSVGNKLQTTQKKEQQKESKQLENIIKSMDSLRGDGKNDLRAFKKLIGRIDDILLQLEKKPDTLQKNIQQVRNQVSTLHKLIETEKGQMSSQTMEPIMQNLKNLNYQSKQFDETDKLFINNAGLILFWPFLNKLFTDLGLVQEREFLSLEARQKAVMVLQYLADELCDPSEFELSLNKILCGLEPDDFVDILIELKDSEKEKCDMLIHTILTMCPLWKNMSVDGLRQAHVLREGALSIVNDVWQLNINKQTYDVVLDHLPWSTEVVKLPWMSNVMYVHWTA